MLPVYYSWTRDDVDEVSFYRVIPAEPNTQVQIDGINIEAPGNNDGRIWTGEDGNPRFYDTGVKLGGHVISADKPIQVLQMLPSTKYNSFAFDFPEDSEHDVICGEPGAD